MYGQDLSGKSKMKQKVILAIFRQNIIKDHKNIKFDQEDYIYFQIVRLHSEDKTMLTFHWHIIKPQIHETKMLEI